MQPEVSRAIRDDFVQALGDRTRQLIVMKTPVAKIQDEFKPHIELQPTS